jgi:hypothetical protein
VLRPTAHGVLLASTSLDQVCASDLLAPLLLSSTIRSRHCVGDKDKRKAQFNRTTGRLSPNLMLVMAVAEYMRDNIDQSSFVLICLAHTIEVGYMLCLLCSYLLAFSFACS